MRETRPQTGRAPSALTIAPMKRRGLPLWLLRDVPALLGVMISFWPLMIMVITNGRRAASGKKVRQSTYDHFAILLAHAEARLAFALWRQAYRRLALNVRGVIFHLVPASENWDETCDRFRAYSRACREMNAHVDVCVEDLRARFAISERDATSPVHRSEAESHRTQRSVVDVEDITGHGIHRPRERACQHHLPGFQ